MTDFNLLYLHLLRVIMEQVQSFGFDWRRKV